MKSKQGYQMIEASLVMPLIILISVSVVFVIVFFYECLDIQCNMHENMIALENESGKLYKKERMEKINESRIRGISDFVLQRRLQADIYLINESMMIRIGDKGYELEE